MKRIVLGAGGVGMVTAGLMAHAGRAVYLVGRERQVAAFGKRPLTVHANGERILVENNFHLVAPAPEGIADVIIFATKSFSIPELLEEVRPYVGENTVLISLQNGVNVEAEIQRAYPKQTVVAGIINGHFDLPAPNEASWVGKYGALVGGYLQGDPVAAEQAWKDSFQGLALPAIYYPDSADVKRIKWSKLVLNVGFNALNAITRKSPSEILEDKEFGEIAAKAFQEAFAVMRALEVQPVELPEANIRLLEKICSRPLPDALRTLRMTTPKQEHAVRSSMLQDLDAGRKQTEIMEINGAVVHYGATLGVDVSANREIIARLEARLATH